MRATIPIAVNRSVIYTHLITAWQLQGSRPSITRPPEATAIPVTIRTPPKKAPQPPSSMARMTHRAAISVTGNRSVIYTHLSSVWQLQGSRPGITRHPETTPIPVTICTLPRKAPEPPSRTPSITLPATTSIPANHSTIFTLLQTAPQLPSSMPSLTRRQRATSIPAIRGITCTRRLLTLPTTHIRN